MCRKVPTGKRSAVRYWGTPIYDHNKLCDHADHYNYHLLLLAVLRNGWKGTCDNGYTTLSYCSNNLRVKFDSGNNLCFGLYRQYAYYIRCSFSSFLDIVLPIEYNPPSDDSTYYTSDDSDD